MNGDADSDSDSDSAHCACKLHIRQGTLAGSDDQTAYSALFYILLLLTNSKRF